MRRPRASVTLLFVFSVLVACTRTSEGPLAYAGSPNDWIGPVAVGQPRAWGLIHFGREGLRATVLEVTLDTPLPEGLAAKVELNTGEPVAIGGIERPEGSTAQGVPGTISGAVQIVVWFRASLRRHRVLHSLHDDPIFDRRAEIRSEVPRRCRYLFGRTRDADDVL
jgi:hypothetical protein